MMNTKTETLLLALGSNLGQREENMKSAVDMLRQAHGMELIKVSENYKTSPIDFSSDNEFLNAAALFRTNLEPHQVLSLTQHIETQLGRRQKSKAGIHYDRTIDIDIIDQGQRIIDTPALILPHPRAHLRRFVLQPLCDICPNHKLPNQSHTILELLTMLNTQFKIEKITHFTEEVAAALAQLLPQLSSSPFELERLGRVIESPQSALYVIRDETDTICGTITLALYPCLSGEKAWIEDLVVDSKARGRGYARQLVAHAIAEAKSIGVKKVLLTSRPSRSSANQLYRSMGFEQRQTNVYQMITDYNS